MATEYIHPSVSSRIIDQSVVFASAQGSTRLFVALTSDQGPDNKMVELGSADEFVALFGEPNMPRHGQAAYNAYEWLQSGGGAQVLRVTPEDAKLSHVMIGVQVSTAAGSPVLRTVTRTTPVRSGRPQALLADMRDAQPETPDGFEQYFLAAFYPRYREIPARGAYYDQFGVQLRLRTDLDNTYAFRTWDLYITKENSSGVQEAIEGPFLVSFDPEAVSTSNESLHIQHVVNTYSLVAGCEANPDAWEALCAIINESADPAKIDFLTLQERNDEQAETLHAGARLEEAADPVTASIVGMGNTARTAVAVQAGATVTTMEDALDKLEVGAATYDAHAGGLSSALGDLLGTLPTPAAGTLEKLNQTLGSAATEAARKTAADAVRDFGRANIAAVHRVVDVARILTSGSDVINTDAATKLAHDLMASMEANEARVTGAASKVAERTAEVQTANLGSDLDAKMEAVSKAVPFARATFDLVSGLSTETDANATAALAAIEAAEEAHEAATLATPMTRAAKVAAAVAAALAANAALLLALETNLVEDMVAKAEGIYAALKDAMVAAQDAVVAATAASGGPFSVLAPTARAAIEAAKDARAAALELTFFVKLQDPTEPMGFGAGSDGALTFGDPRRRAATAELLAKAYLGILDPEITNKRLVDVDVLLDANYPESVKAAMVQLARDIRKDCVAFVDTGFTATPDQALGKRASGAYSFSTYHAALYTQDFIRFDSFTGADIQVTTPFYLARKMPGNDVDNGIQYALAGPRRGEIDDFKHLSFNPTEPWKERLYKAQLNYVERDKRRTNLGTQLTSQKVTSALSDINNVRVLLKIVRNLEEIAELYKFEFNDDVTYSQCQAEMGGVLNQWVANRALTSATVSVFASDYDRKRKQARVRVELSFNNVIERFLLDFIVK